MNITDKQAVEAAEVLRGYCKQNAASCTCILDDENTGGCFCEGKIPEDWIVPTLPAEPAPAEPDEPYLCKLFGAGVGERFDVLHPDGTTRLENVWITSDGMPVIDEPGDVRELGAGAFADLIEIAAKHPDRIRRKPKVVLTEDDKVIVRRPGKRKDDRRGD